MIETLNEWIKAYNEYIGGYLILALLLPTGIFFTIKFRFLQITKFGHAFKIVAGKFSKKSEPGDISHFKALTTALSATVGTGNIVGVSLAINYGGPGAVFWLWVTGFLGMMLKLVECTLAHKFRRTNADGSVSGGPMYYMEFGLKEQLGRFAKVLAVIFSVAAILCSLGTGNMAQSNSMTDVLFVNYQILPLYSGLIITFLVFLIIIGGLKRIADVTSKLVPLMAIFYLTSTFIVLGIFIKEIPSTFYLIVSDAFTPSAATGGFIGSTIIMTMVWGIRRGLFSNEAGQGSAPMAHAAAKTDYPLREGLVSSLEPFIDTIVICTLTALVVIISGAWSSGIAGVGMTVLAFESGFSSIGVIGIAKHVVAFSLLLFAFSTIISWSYYGTRAAQYLAGDKAIRPYYYLYCLFVFFGCIWSLDIVWNIVDMLITFMTIPNLIALLLLTPVMKKEIDTYFISMRNKLQR
ncbi:MAG: sodium:alanine symporter family protein [Bacteroidales bacterium]|nr:sodium:alanine symporter family protein [Bacteroidales bacterium]